MRLTAVKQLGMERRQPRGYSQTGSKKERDIEGLSDSMRCAQLYNEIIFDPF